MLMMILVICMLCSLILIISLCIIFYHYSRHLKKIKLQRHEVLDGSKDSELLHSHYLLELQLRLDGDYVIVHRGDRDIALDMIN